jgi:ABC-2 type transport system permease protein
MSKTALIIKREYLSRVRKKSFVVMSIVGPLLFAAMMVLPAWFASMEDSQEKQIAVIDQTGLYKDAIPDAPYAKFVYLGARDEAAFLKEHKELGFDAFVVISADLLDRPDAIKMVSEAQITIDMKEHVQRGLKPFLDRAYLQRKNMAQVQQIIDELNKVQVDLTTVKLGDDGSQRESSTEITMILSIVFAMMVYMFVLVYGTQVMRGVMEEKTNRIVEVIISSVKPFQLMMGKIVGIALVALTQFSIWIVLTLIIVGGIVGLASGGAGAAPQMQQMQQMAAAAGDANGFEQVFMKTMSVIDWGTVSWSLAAFMFYFLGGYLLYASLFAALGSAIDGDSDSQQFVMPVMMPLILSIYVAMSAFRNPGGDLAFWFSMIPFTSPVVMMARIPFQIPLWEILLSMAILAGSFVGSTWLAGRIYRTGILMYGKKTSWKEMWRWFLEAGKR